MTKRLKSIAFVVMMLVGTAVVAAPISYQGDLTAAGVVESQLENSHWWRFSANAGDIITITAQRLEAALDPAMYLFSGAGDTNALSFLGFADDNIAAGVSGGPFADPQFSNFGIAATGDYSLRIFSFVSFSAGADGVYDYSIEVDGSTAQVSEPATFGIMAMSLMGLIGLRRKFA